MSNGQVLIQRDGYLVNVILSAPERLNALNRKMWQQLRTVFLDLNEDTGIRCVILRGEGDKAFAAGADIAEFEKERYDVESAREYGADMHSVLQSLVDCPHPVIAMIKGPCIGGGLEIASVCDLRICSTSSRFGVPVKNLGLVVAYAELKGLVDLVGASTTLEIVLEGRVFDAEEALGKGLVNRVVPDHELETEVYKTAQRISDGAPLVARWHKKFVRRLIEHTPISKTENEESFNCFGTDDFQIGYRAFLSKRKPEFKGS